MVPLNVRCVFSRANICARGHVCVMQEVPGSSAAPGTLPGQASPLQASARAGKRVQGPSYTKPTQTAPDGDPSGRGNGHGRSTHPGGHAGELPTAHPVPFLQGKGIGLRSSSEIVTAPIRSPACCQPAAQPGACLVRLAALAAQLRLEPVHSPI